jgi:hypothetical protein
MMFAIVGASLAAAEPPKWITGKLVGMERRQGSPRSVVIGPAGKNVVTTVPRYWAYMIEANRKQYVLTSGYQLSIEVGGPVTFVVDPKCRIQYDVKGKARDCEVDSITAK